MSTKVIRSMKVASWVALALVVPAHGWAADAPVKSQPVPAANAASAPLARGAAASAPARAADAASAAKPAAAASPFVIGGSK